MTGLYDVALSFAGEDRALAERVARALQGEGLKVFYDQDELGTLWGRDLIERFTSVFGNEARFAVLFISKAYATKAWPRQERRAALARALREEGEYILPVRLDDVEVEGLLSTTGYVDLRTTSEAELVALIVAKVRRGGTTTKGSREDMGSPSRMDVLEVALKFARSFDGPEMESDDARAWAEHFADRWSMEELKRYRKAFGIGHDHLEWSVEDSMHFGRAVLEWTSDQFVGFCKVFEYASSFSGPGLDPHDALDVASSFAADFPSVRFGEFTRAVSLAEEDLELEGRAAADFALEQLGRG